MFSLDIARFSHKKKLSHTSQSHRSGLVWSWSLIQQKNPKDPKVGHQSITPNLIQVWRRTEKKKGHSYMPCPSKIPNYLGRERERKRPQKDTSETEPLNALSHWIWWVTCTNMLNKKLPCKNMTTLEYGSGRSSIPNSTWKWWLKIYIYGLNIFIIQILVHQTWETTNPHQFQVCSYGHHTILISLLPLFLRWGFWLRLSLSKLTPHR